MRMLSVFLMAILWVGVSQANVPEKFSVCENCVLEKAVGEYYANRQIEDYEIFAEMNYTLRDKPYTKNGNEVLFLDLANLDCKDPFECALVPTLGELAMVGLYGAKDPLGKSGNVSLTSKVMVGGKVAQNTCELYSPQSQGEDGKLVYTYNDGVNVSCRAYLPDQRVMSLNLYFKRLPQ